MILTSAAAVLARLNEPNTVSTTKSKISALHNLNELVDEFWPEIAGYIPTIEMLYEDNSFSERKLAASVVSKVYYHLDELEDSVSYALEAGELFDIQSKTPYVETLIAQCINRYIDLQNKFYQNETEKIDPKLIEIVERMFKRCYNDKEYKQALGVAVEAKKIDKIREAITIAPNIHEMLSYCFSICQNQIENRGFRMRVFRELVDIYRNLEIPDMLNVCRCLLLLDDAESIASILTDLTSDSEKSSLSAYQIAFDLWESQNHSFISRVYNSVQSLTKNKKLLLILSGTCTSDFHLQFLYSHNRYDVQCTSRILEKLDNRYAITHNALVISHAIAQCGTSQDVFLRENLEWLSKAANWAKFTAAASFGVVHKGHVRESFKLLGSYLPKEGQQGSPYQEGGALYAMGLIHCYHGDDRIDYLLKELSKSANNEIVQHGACLGLGLVSMATGSQTVYEALKEALYSDNAVAGEAAGLAIGLALLGTNNEIAIDDLISYAHETKHEKIIRGIAIGLAFIVYEREEEADPLIERMCSDLDPLIRYGGCFAIAMAYVATGHNNSIKKLLHIAVSDVSSDVRRAAVMSLGFILCATPEQVPNIVKLLAESFNPHARYGAAFAIGISCSATGMQSAIDVLEPLLKDRVDYVKQAAQMSIAMVLLQQNKTQTPKTTEIKDFLNKIIDSKTTSDSSSLVKMGAIIASGIFSMGGNNCTVSMVSDVGYKRMVSIVGLAVFLQHWYWFPFLHFISLAITPTVFIGLNKDLKMPRFYRLKSNATPQLYEYPPSEKTKVVDEKKQSQVVELSITAKAKARKERKLKGKGESMDIDEDNKVEMKEKSECDIPKEDYKMDTSSAVDSSEKELKISDEEIWAKELSRKAEKSKTYSVLENPCRVTPLQSYVISEIPNQRYKAIKKKLSGIVILEDLSPEKEQNLVVSRVFDECEIEEDPAPPKPFELDMD